MTLPDPIRQAAGIRAQLMAPLADGTTCSSTRYSGFMEGFTKATFWLFEYLTTSAGEFDEKAAQAELHKYPPLEIVGPPGSHEKIHDHVAGMLQYMLRWQHAQSAAQLSAHKYNVAVLDKANTELRAGLEAKIQNILFLSAANRDCGVEILRLKAECAGHAHVADTQGAELLTLRAELADKTFALTTALPYTNPKDQSRAIVEAALAGGDLTKWRSK